MQPSAASLVKRKWKHRRKRLRASLHAAVTHAASAATVIVINAVAVNPLRAEMLKTRRSRADQKQALEAILPRRYVKVVRAASAVAEIAIAHAALKARQPSQPSQATVRSARMRSAKVAETNHVATALAGTNRVRKSHVLMAMPKRVPMMRPATHSVAAAIVDRRIPISDVAVRDPVKQRVAN